jgi:DNA-binding protein H-NS
MSISLRLPYAKVLAELRALDQFEQIRACHDLTHETTELQQSLRRKAAKEIKALRNNGATWEDISDKTGLRQAELFNLTKGRP